MDKSIKQSKLNIPSLGRAALMVVGSLSWGEAQATIPDANGAYTACFTPGWTYVRVIDTAVTTACRLGEKKISWNKQGAQGPAGLNGAVGATGPAGPIGATGSQGPAGQDGAPGAMGAAGPVGPQGETGLAGATGPAGAQGLPGAAGAAGPIGATGPQGSAGQDGAPGTAGPQGEAGLAGAQGLPGATGAVGPAGPAGAQGLPGATGPQGPAGLDGAAGAIGPVGPAGSTGAQGLPGADGAVGPAGPIGATGPQGPAGQDGAPGAVGAAGPAGVQGPQGETGPAGLPGSFGSFAYKIGDVGPGGGFIFFVDYFDQFPGFTYLEAAPANASGAAWCNPANTSIPAAAGWVANAVGRGQANTTAMLGVCTSGAANAADAYVAPNTTDDWFLPSLGEAMLMYTNLRQAGVGGFTNFNYLTSTEQDANSAWNQNFSSGSQVINVKGSFLNVRAVRAF